MFYDKITNWALRVSLHFCGFSQRFVIFAGVCILFTMCVGFNIFLAIVCGSSVIFNRFCRFLHTQTENVARYMAAVFLDPPSNLSNALLAFLHTSVSVG